MSIEAPRQYPFGPIDRQQLEQIIFSEMLTISRCGHIPTKAADRSYIDSVILDLNQLTPIGSMYIGVTSSSSDQLRLTRFIQFESGDCRQEIHETRATVDVNLQMIEENHEEITRFGDHRRNRKEWKKYIECAPYGDGAFLVRNSQSNDIGNSFEEQRIRYISEELPLIFGGVACILERYLVRTGYVGTVEGQMLDVHGKLCRVKYEIGDRRPGHLNSAEMEIVRVRRTMTGIDDGPAFFDVTKSIFLSSGHLLRRKFKWHKRAYLAHLNPLQCVPPLDFRTDFEGPRGLRSFLMYEKDNERSIVKTYDFLEANTDVRNLMQFYLLAVIASKPNDVLRYSINHFMSLGLDCDYVY